MMSIRKRLFVILLAAIGTIWLAAVLWIQTWTRDDVEHVLDRRLQESAHMVASLIGQAGVTAATAAEQVDSAPALPGAGRHDYARQMSCQVWGLDGRLIGGSKGAPDGRLADDDEGFSEKAVGSEVWRVYSLVDRGLGIRVMVGDTRTMRDRLVSGVTLGLLPPALLVLPFIAFLIWWAVGAGLAPLDRMAETLARRTANDLGALDEETAPKELRPMIAALNGLFRRVDLARERERSFTAFAAHELKTPLAGLKTQAQIAVIAPDEPTRRRALTQLAGGVDRTDRMVRQLLDMTAVENAPDPAGSTPIPGGRVLTEVADDLSALAVSRGVALRIDPGDCRWATPGGTLLASALRNLIENAIAASPPGAAVDAVLHCEDGRAVFRIADRGPGISERDRPHVTERFYRGAGSREAGSGLGLAIVAAAMDRMRGTLRLLPRDGGGELAELVLPATASGAGKTLSAVHPAPDEGA
ncbi:histidine kinase [Azospirillum thiophilum]|uniref:histidine kinase n=1 Tax=Azospirillum thiophilum TaxID=528244 RepID=A0AAC9EY47_9PROT|nr:ATP-binding protein [Azospirillum thiophilum]ALG73614.1 histidine kinase [Azospirillum thiophilum]KJR63003.1 histidine kinase [Azospirillum thiophilum]